MSVTIDRLEVEIQSSSSGAAAGIDALAASLGNLKKNGTISVAVKNLNNLASALSKIQSVSAAATSISFLASAMGNLKSVGSVGNSVNKLADGLRNLGNLDISSLPSKILAIATAVTPLSSIKTSGLSSMVNALSKIREVTSSLSSQAIEEFANKIKRLIDILTPLSEKLVTIQAGLRGLNGSARSAGEGADRLGKKVNKTTLNMASFVTVMHGVLAVLRPVVRLLSDSISQAIEWDGITARFGRGFGAQAGEVYAWVQRLNEELGINIQQFMQYSSIFSTMLQGFGVGAEDASKMAVGYTELIYDIWAGYNDVYKHIGDAADAVKSAIAGEVEPIRRAGFTIVESTLEQTAANHGLEISLANATEAQKSYLRYLTLVDQAHAQNLVGTYARELNTAEGLVRTFAQQVKSLAQAFGSLFLPVLVKVMPWLQAFVELLTQAIQRVAAFFGVEIQPVDWSGYGSGFSVGAAGLDDVSDAADTATGSLDDTADAVGKTANALKDLKKATIGIDELNVISPPSSSSSGSGGGSVSDGGGSVGGLGAFEGLDVGSLWDQSIFDQVQFDVDQIIGKIKDALTTITAVISGFMLAIGTILVVTNANMPLGIALMAAGAVGLVASIATNWDSMSEQLAKTLTTITAVLGGFLLAIGAFLAFSGVNVGLGAGLMVAGAVSVGTALTLNWKFLEGDMKNTLSILTGIVSGGLLAVGALFAFSGVDVRLGIGLMVAGAVGLATTAGLNWNYLSEPMRKAIGVLMAIVGSSLLALGAVLTFSGANIALGITMMAAGAVSLVAATTLNWGSITSNLKNAIATIVALVSGALIGVGAVLAFTGVAMPLGIALMAAGAIGLVATASVNWSWLTEKIKIVLKELGGVIGTSLLAVGAVLAFSGVALPLGIALIAAGAVTLVTAAVLNWNAVVNAIKTVLQKIGIIAGLALLAIGIVLVCTGVALPLGIGLIAAGAVGLVAGVALNWNTIINAVSDFIKKVGRIAGLALVALGVILLCFGVVPIGIGLIAAGLVSYTVSAGLAGDYIVEITEKTLGRITELWEGVVSGCTKPLEALRDGVIAIFEWMWDVLVGHSIVPDTVDGIVDCFVGLPGRVLGVVTKFVGNIIDKFKDFGSKVIKKVSDGWNSVREWWKGKKDLDIAKVGVSLVKTGWSTIKKWIGKIPVVSQAVGLAKSGWSSVKKWIGGIPKISQGVGLVKSGWSSVKKWVGTMPTLKAKIGLLKSGWTSIKSWLGGLNFKLKFTLPKIKVNWSEKTVAGFKIKYPSGFSTYAKGGFPGVGEMFIAREAGPEMVGKIGNRTTVANNDQIVEGISEGVYAAVVSAMRNSENGRSQSVNVYLDGRQIYSSMEQHRKERGAGLMGSQVYSY